MLCRFFRLPSSSSVVFLPWCLLFRCIAGLWLFFFVLRFPFVRVGGPLLFFLLFSCHSFFCNLLSWLTYLCVLVCCFICLPVCFLVFFITLTYSSCTVYPFFALYCSPWSSLVTIFVSGTLLFFCTVCIPHKTSRSRPFGVLFALFFAFPLAPTSVRAHPNRYVRTCTHPHHFLPTPQKHDVRGNFPGHRDQILVCTTINAPFLPCLCAPHAPCTPTHPCAPVRTHTHLFLPVYTLLFMYICVI